MSSIDNDLGLTYDQVDADGGNNPSAYKQTSQSDARLRNLIRIKESEIAALKEVITKWRTRALDAHIMHTQTKAYFNEQLAKLQMQHQNEINAIKNTRSKNAFEGDDEKSAKIKRNIECKMVVDKPPQDLDIYSSEATYGQVKVLERLVKSFPKLIRKTTKKPKCMSINPAAIDLNLKTLDHKHKCYNISKSDLKQPSLLAYKSDDSISKSSSLDTIVVEERNQKDILA
ncbi:hypothetical protein K501DRAFT_279582 [Backusella circina FSU 941]|nr:hypothetical protein K501DRAFT_279582 [Backusella circina FSU 941]